MTNPHDEIDQLVAEVERTIAESEETLQSLPDFESRNQRVRSLEQAVVTDQ